jgi:hypothetical protein
MGHRHTTGDIMVVRRCVLAIAVTLAGLVTAPAAAHPDPTVAATAVLDAVPEVYVNARAGCNVRTGQWSVLWELNKAAEPVTVTGALDPISGATLHFGVVSDRLQATETLPGTATAAGLTVTVTSASNPAARSHSRTLALPGGCAVRPVVSCPEETAYAHTFEPALGYAVVRVANDIYCDNQGRTVYLSDLPELAPDVYGSTPGYRLFLAGSIGRGTGILVLQVDVVPCGYQLHLTFNFPPLTATGGPTTGSLTLGGPNAPGNRSTGPVGSFRSPPGVCVAPAVVRRVLHCDNSFGVVLHNGSGAALPAVLELSGPNVFQSVPVLPGQTVSVLMTPVPPPRTVTLRIGGLDFTTVVQPTVACARGRALFSRPPVPRRFRLAR